MLTPRRPATDADLISRPGHSAADPTLAFLRNLIQQFSFCFPQTLNGMKTSTTVRHLVTSFPSRFHLIHPGLIGVAVVVVVADYESLRIIGLSVAGFLFITGVMIISCK